MPVTEMAGRREAWQRVGWRAARRRAWRPRSPKRPAAAHLKTSFAVDFENLKPPLTEDLDVLLAVHMSSFPLLLIVFWFKVLTSLFDNMQKKKRKSEIEANGSSLVQSSPPTWFSSSKSTNKVPLSSVTSIFDGPDKLWQCLVDVLS
ncbi:hypothetical protein LguiB_013540 [Lonicera macranthoides]